MITRRRLLMGGAATAAVSAAGVAMPWGFGSISSHARIIGAAPLAIPPLLKGNLKNGVRTFDLTLKQGQSTFLPGYTTSTLGINGPYLGPTLHFTNGEKVRLNVKNTIGETTTIHWHGLHVPAIADGGPHQVIGHGETWSPSFTVKQQAGLFWYHPHLLHKTGLHAYLGMAGGIRVENAETDALPLPKTYGVDDLPVVLQDKRFNSDGSLQYGNSMHDLMMGMKGDVLLVNGGVAPIFKATTAKLRLRLLNGSNARTYNLGFKDNRSFDIIAGDGSLLPAPVKAGRAVIAPGERVEIVVDVKSAEPAELVTYPYESVGAMGRGMGRGMMGRGMMGRMMGMMGDDGRRFEVLRIEPGEKLAPSPRVPDELLTLPALNARDAVRTRRFELDMGMGPMMMMGRSGFTINGKTMDMSRIDARVKLGTTEIWEIANLSPMMHPFHIHDIQFRILDRNGRPPAPYESGLKDTVQVNSGEVVRVIAKFEDYADPKWPYMFHCHILEHEDAGMMGQFTVEA